MRLQKVSFNFFDSCFRLASAKHVLKEKFVNDSKQKKNLNGLGNLFSGLIKSSSFARRSLVLRRLLFSLPSIQLATVDRPRAFRNWTLARKLSARQCHVAH